jgi:hypothetical protein
MKFPVPGDIRMKFPLKNEHDAKIAFDSIYRTCESGKVQFEEGSLDKGTYRTVLTIVIKNK